MARNRRSFASPTSPSFAAGAAHSRGNPRSHLAHVLESTGIHYSLKGNPPGDTTVCLSLCIRIQNGTFSGSLRQSAARLGISNPLAAL